MARPEDRVALIEWLGSEGQVLRSLDVHAWPVSLGRALDNTVVLDDPHVAAHHACLAPDAEGRLQLQALPTRNGLRFDGQPLGEAVPEAAGPGATSPPAMHPVSPAGGLLQLGQTRLRLRLAGDAAALPPERPLPAVHATLPRGWRMPALAGAALAALALAEHGVGLDPGADFAAWLPLLLGLPVALVAWCGAWALLSKLFQHRFDFAGHLRLALPWLLALQALSLAWPALSAALAWPTLWRAGHWLENMGGALLLHAHLRHMLPQHGRAVGAATLAMVTAGTVLAAALNWRSHDRLVAAPYMSTLPLPALRLGGTSPTAELVQEVAPLAEALAERAERARREELESGAEGEGGDGGE